MSRWQSTPHGKAKMRAKRVERKAWIDGIKLERGCVDCGYRAHPSALDFDHVRGVKLHNIASMLYGSSVEAILAEMEKCEVVCANCHRIRTVSRHATPLSA